jgi:hypothetical protein
MQKLRNDMEQNHRDNEYSKKVKMIKVKQNQKINEYLDYYNASNYIITLLMQSNQQHHLLVELYARKTHK